MEKQVERTGEANAKYEIEACTRRMAGKKPFYCVEHGDLRLTQ